MPEATAPEISVDALQFSRQLACLQESLYRESTVVMETPVEETVFGLSSASSEKRP